MKRNGWYQEASIYRLAPVYAKTQSPVAWAVSKDRKLEERHVLGEGGLSGLILQPRNSSRAFDDCSEMGILNMASAAAMFCASAEEHETLRNLTRHLAHGLETKSSSSGIPLVALTDPSNPFGQFYLLVLTVVLYSLTLLALVLSQVDLCCALLMPTQESYVGIEGMEKELTAGRESALAGRER